MIRLSRNSNYIINCQCNKCKELITKTYKGDTLNERILKEPYMPAPEHNCLKKESQDELIFATIISIIPEGI